MSLYRRLLRLHTELPEDFKRLGVGYIRDEFKRHKDLKDEQNIKQFVNEWQVRVRGSCHNLRTLGLEIWVLPGGVRG